MAEQLQVTGPAGVTGGQPRGARRHGRLLARAARSLAAATATLVATSFIVFTALSFAPGDPVAQILGSRATPEQRAAMREQLGLDRPLVVRYLDWVGGTLSGDLGTSLTYRQEVTALLEPRLATTALLVLMAAVLIVVIGVALGAAGGLSDRWRPVFSAISGVGIAIPGFIAGSVLIGVFAVQLGWFPTFGAGEGPLDRIWHLTLPAVALAIGWSSYVAQMTSAAVKEEVGREHVQTARSRGVPPVKVFARHIMLNASIPVLTASGLTVAGLVAGSVVVESVFGVDGIGSLLVSSVSNKDYSPVLAISMIIVTVFVVLTTLIDLAQTLIDPRLRGGS